ncbi:MAG: U32 family peptidase [Cyclobacteriaceae bacterium]|nr:U32 family peptidase [Cyclobacteriaceae bacterium]
MNIKQDVKVLAPVGSWESLRAAVQAGADAVYFGIEQLNMRARSSINFTLEDLEQIAGICKEEGIGSYITINTILYDHDLKLMRHIIDTAKASGIDAIIAMDHAAINYANEIGMPVHISTQVNITNIESVKFYAKFSEVMVLSRELTLQQVEYICAQVKKQNITAPSGNLVQIETFVHGALCMAVSGKCYMSLHTMNSSANRGACKQNCRRSYTVKDEDGNELKIDNEYIMSPKDLCTINFVDKIMDAGVKVLKIEGRSKGPEYVFETTNCYRQAVDAWKNDVPFTPELVMEWEKRLSAVYNRGFWGGYFMGKKMGEWADKEGSIATEEKVYLGKGKKYFDKIGVGEFKLDNGELKVGDEILITSREHGIFKTKVSEIRLDNQESAGVVKRGQVFSMPIEIKIRPSDNLYKIVARQQ